MASSKKYYWLKLKDDFFRQKEIKKLRKIAGGDTYTVIYLKMLLVAMKYDNKIYFDGVEDSFSEELALELDEDTDNVKMTLAFLQNQNLIEMVNEDEYMLPQCKSMVGVESASAERVRKHRLKNKDEPKALQCNTDVTECNSNVKKGNTEIEKEKEIDIELEKEQQQEEKEYVVVVDKIRDYFKLDEKDVKKVANTYLATGKEIDYLIEKLDLSRSTPNVSNLVGFLIKAIEEDYPPAITTNTSMDKGKKFIPRVNTRFHNINQTFDKYDPDELEKILKESQKGKFN